MITIIELARIAGVSDATVSLVLSGKDRGRVGAARRQQILDLARKHGYRTNPAALALAKGRTNRVGLCIAGSVARHAIIGEFSLHVRLGLFAESLQNAGYAIEIIQEDPRQPAEVLCRSLTQRMVDGMVFLNWPANVLDKPLFSLKERGIPAVASGTILKDAGFTWSDVDEPAAFADAVRLLTREGRTRIALLDAAVGVTLPTVARSFRTAMRRHAGCSAREIVTVRATPADYETTCAAVAAILERLPNLEGLVLTDNFLAQSALNALKAAGRRPGTDVRVIGFGDTILADQCRPKLSHYSLQIEAQVQFGTDALLEQIQNGATYRARHALLCAEYVARET